MTFPWILATPTRAWRRKRTERGRIEVQEQKGIAEVAAARGLKISPTGSKEFAKSSGAREVQEIAGDKAGDRGDEKMQQGTTTSPRKAGMVRMIARPREVDWWQVEPRQARWWMATPRAMGRTWRRSTGGQERRGEDICEVATVGAPQIPGAAGYTGCWKCGCAGHRAADCGLEKAAQAEDWMVGEIVRHGREMAMVQVQQMMGRAELRAQVQVQEQQQQSWAQVAQQPIGAGQAQVVAKRPKTEAELKAAARYNEIRRARYANMAAEKAREGSSGSRGGGAWRVPQAKSSAGGEDCTAKAN